MNAVVQYDASVPAFLRNANFLALNTKAAAGLSSGAPPRLSFKGSRFRLVAADGTETPLPGDGQPGNNSISLDVIVLDASEHVSKFYYDKKYDPSAEDMSPACFSDNGIGPSVRASKPQSLLCQGCPKNAWGSKITDLGSSVKACSDVKKIAVIPVSNVDGPAYMVGIPAASLKTWTGAVNAVTQRGIPIPALVIRIGFDPDPAYPKLTFSPQRYINEQEAAAIGDLFNSDECAELVGRKDTAIQALPAGAATTVHVSTQGPATAAHPVAQPAAPVFQQPQQEPIPAFMQRQPEAAQQAAQPIVVAQEAPKRRRRTAAEMAQANGGAPAPAAPIPAPAAAASGPADLNALLDKVMAGKQ